MSNELPFERPLAELRNKIDELKKFGTEREIDFSDEINRLEIRYTELEQEIYGNLSAAQMMHLARHHARPTTLDYIPLIFTDFIELHGDRMFADDMAIVGGLARLNGVPVTVVGHQRGKDTKDNIQRFFGSPHPEGFRKALRLMRQANKFGRPIITLIDTKGAYPGNTAEERNVSEAIARNLMEMATFGVPIICVVIGEGGSGGALALGVGNRVLMLENAIYSVISPNGAASILWKDATKADEAAEAMKITASDLQGFGIIEEVIPEPQGGAHRDIDAQAEAIKDAIWRHLQQLRSMSPSELAEDRYRKFRRVGEISIAPETPETPETPEAPEASGSARQDEKTGENADSQTGVGTPQTEMQQEKSQHEKSEQSDIQHEKSEQSDTQHEKGQQAASQQGKA